MRVLNPKKLMISCLLFLLANFTAPSIAQELPSAPITQKATVAVCDYSQTQLSSPFILNMAQYFPDIAQNAVVYSATSTLQDMQNLYGSFFQFNANLVAPLPERKGKREGYLWLGSTFDHMEKEKARFFTELATLFTNQEFISHHTKMNPQLAPKIVEDSATHNVLLAAAFEQSGTTAMQLYIMLTNFYTLFSSYNLLQKKSEQEIIIHGGPWGKERGVDGFNCYVLQIVAATLANVTTLSLHASNSMDEALRDEAIAFAKEESGKKVSSLIELLSAAT